MHTQIRRRVKQMSPVTHLVLRDGRDGEEMAGSSEGDGDAGGGGLCVRGRRTTYWGGIGERAGGAVRWIRQDRGRGGHLAPVRGKIPAWNARVARQRCKSGKYVVKTRHR
jgi:hypothetical protein